ncbi:MAG TPA: nitrilase-related carbon-nitrogen hydrolase [Fimbriimonadaceae bacterium]|nr:nitrilase-related carbon-nitrogen hydrolase [Fimbriimonadaceae bacterium]
MRYVWLLLAALTSGTMLAASLPLGEQPWLAWFAFVPLIVATRDRRIILGAVAALLTIAVAAFIAAAGIFYRHRSGGDVVTVFGACGKFAITVGIAIAFSSDVGAWRRPAWFFAAIATLAEAIQLLDLPAHLALSQYRHPLMLQLAAAGGIWLPSFLLWWTNFQLARLRSWRLLAACAGLVALSVATSFIRVGAPGLSQTFGVVQISEPTEKGLEVLQTEASKGHPEFVVWPEFAGIVMAGAEDGPMKELSRRPGIAPFITSFTDAYRPKPHNVAALFAQGSESARYAKRKLFGGEKSMHTPGSSPAAVPYSGGVVGLCICFDSCFPEAIRETAALPGVNVIALPTIDPPAANYFMAGMHAAYTPFRAAESGVAMVRSDGNAYSQIVDPSGRIVAETKPGDGVLVASTPIGRRWTLYRMAGDWFLWVCGALVLAGYVAGLRPKGPVGT